MEAVAVVSQYHSVFGVVSTWSAFTQNALWSRDAALHARAYERAQAREAATKATETSLSLSAQMLHEMQSRADIKALERVINGTDATTIFPI